MLEFVIGAVLGAAVLWLLQTQVRRAGGPPAAAPAPAPSSSDAPAPEPMPDPLMRDLYALDMAVRSAPGVSTPDELPRVAPFVALIERFAAPDVSADVLVLYVTGENPVLSWGALAALARRPADPALEQQALGWLNRFNPWTRHFIFLLLEEWRRDDPTLAARVLVRLDESWDASAMGGELERFLRRRGGRDAVSLDGIERPEGYDEARLRAVLTRQVDPVIATPWLALLEVPPVDPRTPPWMPTAESLTLKDLGQVHAPGALTDDGLLAGPTGDAALERVLAALRAEPPRGVLVVGEAGVGKTALARRVAARLSREGWTVFEAGASQLAAGTSLVGMLEGRVMRLRRLLAERPRTLWLVPDFHQLAWAGRTMQDPTSLLEMLVPAIEAGEILVLGETRPAALDRVLVERPELERLLERVRLEPPRDPEVAGLLEAWAAARAARGVTVAPALLTEAALLARQYLGTQAAPGSVLRLLERATAVAARRPGGALTADDLVESLADLTGLPLDILDERRTLDLEAVRARFESRVIGQPEAVDALIERLALIKAGVADPTRPYGVYLFAGGSGTGKTELAKTLAEYLFGAPDRLLRLDMSELQDGAALERLLGGDAIGGVAGNSLAERVRRQPFSVVLLDEFEKAHPRVWDVFLQVFDDGRLTDRRGETADLRHTIIILTSNVGSTAGGATPLGLTGTEEAITPAAVARALARTFRPELLNRLDRVITFQPLTRETMRRILRKELADARERRGLRRRDWAVEFEESALDLLVERGFSPALGARPLKRALERYLLVPLARAIVDRSAPAGDQFLFVRADGDHLKVEFVDPEAGEATLLYPVAGGAGAAPAAPAPADLRALVYDPRGIAEEVVALRAALEALQRRVGDGAWQEAKQALLLEPSTPGFWERADRFERLGRAEYLDRVESALRSAASLLERLEPPGQGPRSAYPRELVRRLAQQLYLVEAASAEALADGPRDAFLAVDALREDGAGAAPAREFARRIADMYAAWGRARGMRVTALEGVGADHALSIAGFAAHALLVPEQGLHVLESDEAGSAGARRVTARVRVRPQPTEPARGGVSGLRDQAAKALAGAGEGAPAVVRRYRESPSPLVRDAARGWRTGRIDRVLAGDFDVIPGGD